MLGVLALIAPILVMLEGLPLLGLRVPLVEQAVVAVVEAVVPEQITHHQVPPRCRLVVGVPVLQVPASLLAQAVVEEVVVVAMVPRRPVQVALVPPMAAQAERPEPGLLVLVLMVVPVERAQGPPQPGLSSSLYRAP